MEHTEGGKGQEHIRPEEGLGQRQYHSDDIAAYFQGAERQFHQHISTIPEGSSVIEKSPSPEHSSGPTTGTTSTPTSCENAIASDDTNERNGAAPEFPRDSLQGESTWGAMPLYAANRLSPPQTQLHTQYSQPDASAERFVQQVPSSPMRYNPANYPSAIKLLVSNNVAASIIGRAGQTISELQAQSRTRIKLSQSGDYFPGTQDRVCLVQGETESVKVAVRLLLERFFVLQEHQYIQHMSWQIQKQGSEGRHSFDFIVRLLVPSSCCGMIIGKSGSNIKFMEESTGVTSVRLSPKDSIDAGFPTSIASVTNERIVTVTASHLDQSTQCLFVILDSMMAHPDISRYTNLTTSYARIMPEGYAVAGSHPLSAAPVHTRLSPPQDPWGLSNVFPYGQPGLQRRFVSAPDLAGVMQGHPIPHQQQQHIQEQHFQRQQNGPTTPERPVMFSHDGLHGGTFHSAAPVPQLPSFMLPSHHSPALQPPQTSLRPSPLGDSLSNMVQVHHSHSAPDLLAFQLEQTMHISNQPPLQQHVALPEQAPQRLAPPAPRPPEGFVPQAPILTAPGCFIAQTLVPEQMVGSILGRQGTALTELQIMSGTRIRVSQRGEYMPGTRSRIVTVRGPSAQSVWQAQYMMSQRIIVPTTAVPAPQGYAPPSSRYVVAAPCYDDGTLAETATPPPPRELHPEMVHQHTSDSDEHQPGSSASEGPSAQP